MSNVIQLVKNDKEPLSDLDLFTAFQNAKQTYECWQMTNIHGKSPEELLEINKGVRKAENEYMALWMQCRQRGIA